LSKAETKAARVAQGFEMYPARCLNCQRFEPPMHGVPPRDDKPGIPYVAPRCGLGGFFVASTSICDQWLGKRGETLEGNKDE
jgi:hypothetical protein